MVGWYEGTIVIQRQYSRGNWKSLVAAEAIATCREGQDYNLETILIVAIGIQGKIWGDKGHFH